MAAAPHEIVWQVLAQFPGRSCYDSKQRDACADRIAAFRFARAELADITFTKLADLSTPVLLQTCASGKTIPKAKLEFMRADGNGDRIKYFEIELENVLVGHVEPDLHPGDILGEHVGLTYSKIKWRYTQQKVSGGAGGSTVGGWDLATNRTV